MTSFRKTSLSAGMLYLISFVSIPTLFLYRAVKDSDYITGPGPDTQVMIGGMLEIIVALAGIGTAVVLFPVVKRQNSSVALGFVARRTLEAATIFVGVMSLLSVTTLRQVGAGPEALIAGQVLAAEYTKDIPARPGPHSGHQWPAARHPDVPIPPGSARLPMMGLIGAPIIYRLRRRQIFRPVRRSIRLVGARRPAHRRLGVLARHLLDLQRDSRAARSP